MRLAFIGLGAMGFPMASNLLEGGFDLVVYNRTRSREEPLAAAGADRATDPMAAAAAADVVVTMVGTDSDVEEVLFGQTGVIHGASSGALVIDMSTIAPAAARSFAERLATQGIDMLDAPVSGGTEGAGSGSLSIFVGGTADSLERARPILEKVGSTITHFGLNGSGQLAKAVNQVIVGGTFLAVAEGIVFAQAAGLTDGEKLVSALSAGAASSWALQKRGKRIMRNEYPLGFRVSLHRKDLRIAADEARHLDIKLPISDLVLELENALVDSGRGGLDLSALATALQDSRRV